MADYNHRETELKWQRFWEQNQTYKTDNQSDKQKYYVLDMFPYPSGAGLHVGHPLGYIASDIVARYKRLKGFNVLHPMGFDSFGLPAEQYAIQTGQHPALTTETNLTRYVEQLKNIGFSYDWSREVRTSDPSYYKWTQWIFMELFRSWYNRDTDKAEPIETLTAKFAQHGTAGVNAVTADGLSQFTADEWHAKTETEQYAITLDYRLTYVADAVVNWCPGLGTVLANDEVKDGPNGTRVSERGGYPVEQKMMRQWMMRITAYADRLLYGLDTIDWTESIKEQQRNWIGRSVGASVRFTIYDLRFTNDGSAKDHPDAVKNRNSSRSGGPLVNRKSIEVFTTRVDTLYGVTFMVLAPEHELVSELTTPEQREAVEAYVAAAKLRSERDRMAEGKTVSGVFTGSYCINPISGEQVPIWLADYVLAGYGTGAVMAVPSGDQRDYLFAKQYNLPIVPVLDAQKNLDTQADNTKEGHYINSDLINGLTYAEATAKLIAALEEKGVGKGKINYRMRDAVFSRQRYWGEPVPVYFDGGLPYLIDEADLPLELPAVDKYLPTETGEPPLGRAEGWKYKNQFPYELSTMPGWAGSSWYWYRYMDPQNPNEFASPEAIAYWKNVDLYIGGTEHATGHLLYSRFWNKFMKDRGYVPEEEPFKKLINQGMIQGRSNFMHWFLPAQVTHSGHEAIPPRNLPMVFISKEIMSKAMSEMLEDQDGVKDSSTAQKYINEQLKEMILIKGINADLRSGLNPISISYWQVDVNLVSNDILDIERLKREKPDSFRNAFVITEPDGRFIVSAEVEKMSKSKLNVVNPDDIVEKYGADVLRLYEMFLGPLEQAKPWNTNGIDGTYRFIRKLWRLFYKIAPNGDTNDTPNEWIVTDEAPTAEELKVLHKTIKKAQEDIENYSFNTSVSAFMVCVNELAALKCHKRAILQDLVLLLSPYAPHVAEELWAALGNEPGTVSKATYPVFNPQYLVEASFEYPIQINGKVRTTISFPLDQSSESIEQEVLANEVVIKWLEGKAPKKVVVVPKRIVNVVP
ncbi:leucine--tRNA ligase [Fibrella aquatilis]|uniref:Leucine--tRNA ligase n=1 Tax=Fibrella aquatilis TaxID=2817059 RepID=A0A939JZ16_9BACT|nr:class I tRNA ligase family protein [Fibrella aquatilis]MBO0929710.1 leucine--tRNA ligase [Fibrella aquatilis]